MKIKLMTIFWGLLFNCLFVSAVYAAPPHEQSGSLVEYLRNGGYVILFRHAATDHSQRDTDLGNPTNCEAQRHLSDMGKQQAKEIGEGFVKLGIPLGDIISSVYCRCSNTAKIAFGRAQTTLDITSIRGVTPEERMRRIQNIRNMINTPPREHANSVMVSHREMIKEATGQALEEGEAAIYKPQPGQYAMLVKRVKAEEWKNLNTTAGTKQDGN